MLAPPDPSTVAPDDVQLRRDWVRPVVLFVSACNLVAAVGASKLPADIGWLGSWAWGVLFFLAAALALPVIFVPFSARNPRWFRLLRRDLVLLSGGFGVVAWASRAIGIVLSILPDGINGEEWRNLIGLGGYLGFAGLTWVCWTTGLGPWVGAHQREVARALDGSYEGERRG